RWPSSNAPCRWREAGPHIERESSRGDSAALWFRLSRRSFHWLSSQQRDLPQSARFVSAWDSALSPEPTGGRRPPRERATNSPPVPPPRGSLPAARLPPPAA